MNNTWRIKKLAVLCTLLGVSACTVTTQNPAPVTSATEPQSTAVPYSPPGGYVPPPAGAVPAGTAGAAGVLGTYVPSYAPVDIHAKQHTVVRGDTVYNIAKRYGITQADLCRWNNIADNVISVGQVLYVKNPAGGSTAGNNRNPSPVGANTPAATSAPVVSPNNQAKDTGLKTVAGITWMKPAPGRLLGSYSPATKGIQIGGGNGSPIVAAADGQVIFSGTLEGYGKLVIIQHNAQYLTAYANNRANQVQEGARVKRGQTIALMGVNGKNGRTQLHFELRKDGHAVDPAPYIPGL